MRRAAGATHKCLAATDYCRSFPRSRPQHRTSIALHWPTQATAVSASKHAALAMRPNCKRRARVAGITPPFRFHRRSRGRYLPPCCIPTDVHDATACRRDAFQPTKTRDQFRVPRATFPPAFHLRCIISLFLRMNSLCWEFVGMVAQWRRSAERPPKERCRIKQEDASEKWAPRDIWRRMPAAILKRAEGTVL
jgi:hypothetical protein